MENFPTLNEMGINQPKDIVRYSLHQVGQIDHLRVTYKRKKGSLLAFSKRFKFGRASKMVVIDSGTRKTATVFEISPFLLKAISELDSIVKSKYSKKDLKADLLDEVVRIEEDFSSQLASLKSLIEKLD